MMPVGFVLVAVISALSLSADSKSLVFPTESSTSYVEMIPQKALSLKAFTLCMQVATEFQGNREFILFAYRTQYYDELNVWRESDGRLSFYLSGEGVFFQVPQLGSLFNHLCFTWDSSTGAANVYVNGKKSLTKIYKKDHTIQAGGRVILGQDPDNYLGNFDAKQSFVGEIHNVNMWDKALPDNIIHNWFTGMRVTKANVFEWESVQLKINGNVHEL